MAARTAGPRGEPSASNARRRTRFSSATSSFSTQAPYIDVAAPGSTIASTHLGTSYVNMSGTSMAAPHVAALAALLRAAHPSDDATKIRARIVDHTIDLGTPGLDDDFGWGLIDPVAATNAP